MFTLTLVTPQKKLVTDLEIDEIFVPAYKGELNILPGHAPLLTTLETGVLRYRTKESNKLKKVAISWGYCEVFPHGVNILAETAEQPKDIDIDRVKVAQKKSEELLVEGQLNMDEIEKFQRKYIRSLVRSEVGESED